MYLVARGNVMKLNKLRILNYKSYANSGEINLGAGINVIVGQNSSGKTALLESINAGVLENKPHRFKANGVPGIPIPNSQVDLEISLTGAELWNAVLMSRGQQWVPVKTEDPATVQQQVAEYFEAPEIKFELSFKAGIGWMGRDTSSEMKAQIQMSDTGNEWSFQGFASTDRGFAPVAMQTYMSSTYLFRAERFIPLLENRGDYLVHDRKHLPHDNVLKCSDRRRCKHAAF